MIARETVRRNYTRDGYTFRARFGNNDESPRRGALDDMRRTFGLRFLLALIVASVVILVEIIVSWPLAAPNAQPNAIPGQVRAPAFVLPPPPSHVLTSARISVG